MKTAYDSYMSPIGNIHVVVDETGVSKVFLTEDQWEEFIKEHEGIQRDKHLCSSVIKQLDEYFSGKRKDFDIQLSVEGTEFGKTVWNALQQIPYGETRSYVDIAQAIGKPKACRAIGQANKRNPLPIIIPCHRVIGANGEMTGYMGKRGIGVKEYLLEMERSYLK